MGSLSLFTRQQVLKFARQGLSEIQNKAHRVRSMHSRSSSFSVVFMCLISATQKFKLEKNTLNTKE